MRFHRPFHERPLNWRKKAWIRIKNRIRLNHDIQSNLFYTDHELDPAKMEGETSTWCDFFFLSSLERNTFWNAYITTAQDKLLGEAHSFAFNKVYEKLSEEEAEAEFKLDFELCEKTHPLGSKMYRLRERPQVRYAQFGDKTFSEEVEAEEQRILSGDTLVVHEEFSIDTSYAYGKGLEIIVDEHQITEAVIDKAIQQFWDNGEKNYKEFSPVPKERLIYQTRKTIRAGKL